MDTVGVSASEPAASLKKPWRIWILQAIAAIQMLAGARRLVTGLMSAGPHLHEPAVLWWLLESMFGLAVVVVLFAGLQRWLRRPEIVAPAVGFLWWAMGVYVAVRSFGQPPTPEVKPFLFDNVSPGAQAGGIVIAHGLILVLVGSLLWHRPSRAYLGGVPRDGGPPSNPQEKAPRSSRP
jgi:hypothetical protein